MKRTWFKGYKIKPEYIIRFLFLEVEQYWTKKLGYLTNANYFHFPIVTVSFTDDTIRPII